MVKKHIVNGAEEFDGLVINQYEGKFAGAFDLPEDVAMDIAYDDVVTFVVTARSGKATLDATKFGDMKRSNAFNVVHVAVLSEDTAANFYRSLQDGSE